MVRDAALILVLALAGCTTVQDPISDPRAVWCAHNQPRRPTLETIGTMTLDEKRDAVAHNRNGALWCGWTH